MILLRAEGHQKLRMYDIILDVKDPWKKRPHISTSKTNTTPLCSSYLACLHAWSPYLDSLSCSYRYFILTLSSECKLSGAPPVSGSGLEHIFILSSYNTIKLPIMAHKPNIYNLIAIYIFTVTIITIIIIIIDITLILVAPFGSVFILPIILIIVVA